MRRQRRKLKRAHLARVSGLRFNGARTNEVAMRMLRWTILTVATSLAVTPAVAQRYDPRYPVCLEVKQQGSMTIDCSFTSLDVCRGTASGRNGTCYANPYWSQAKSPPGRRSRQGPGY
jgi:hypothetical protein